MTDWTTKADNWIEKHPIEFDTFCSIAIHTKKQKEKLGAKAIVERMRWAMNTFRSKPQPKKYLYNNSYTSTLARRAMERHPELKGYFELRGSR